MTPKNIASDHSGHRLCIFSGQDVSPKGKNLDAGILFSQNSAREKSHENNNTVCLLELVYACVRVCVCMCVYVCAFAEPACLDYGFMWAGP